MSTSHPHTCRCGLHAQFTASRQECYRQLAHAILGPTAPQEDRALAHALAEHARLRFRGLIPMRPRRAA